jgi:type I restriction enzyme S subunit
MAAVDAETGLVDDSAEREYAAVAKGYTPFVSGDLLVAKITPCFENGKIAEAVIRRRVGFGSTEFHVIRPGASLDARYALHYLRQPWVRVQGARRMTGSAGQRRVPEDFLAALQIPVPALAEQRRIAAILDKADELRAKRREALAKLDTLTQSIFLEMFGDPVSNSKGWPSTAVLSDVAEISSGVTKGRSLIGKKTRLVPYLAVSNVQDHELDLTVVKKISATDQEIGRYRLEVDDLLLTEGGDPDKLGRGTLWKGELPDCIHQNHIFRVRLRSARIRPLFLAWLVGSSRGKHYFLKSAKQTTGIASINMTQLRAFPLLLPPIERQIEFEEVVASVATTRSRCDASSVVVDKLFASLQHRAFRAEL